MSLIVTIGDRMSVTQNRNLYQEQNQFKQFYSFYISFDGIFERSMQVHQLGSNY